jgi:hypothetical protein
MQYIVILEASFKGITAYSPDIPACTVTCLTEKEAKEALTKELRKYLRAQKAKGAAMPPRYCKAEYIEILEED